MFGNLMMKQGDVVDGIPDEQDPAALADHVDYNPQSLHENLMFGTPDQVIEKLQAYEAAGADHFIYYASMGLGQAEQKRSLELFCTEVIPAFG